jgi:hypothetical protein
MSKEPTLLEETKAKLAELDKEPELMKAEVVPPTGKANYPTRQPLVADTPEQLLIVLNLDLLPNPETKAGILAFVARNPGQAKKLPPEWWESFAEMGVYITESEWNTAIEVGELIANHKFVKTPAATRPQKPPAIHVPVNAII